MIKFKKLDITSYRSIFHCCIDFDSLSGKLYSLEGINNTVEFAKSNGSGKSTLISALLFALYGTTTDSSIKKAEYQNKNTKVKMKLVLDLDIQGKPYTIERTEKEFKLFADGEDISELTKTDTEKKFQNILQLTKNEFCNFTYIPQDGSGSFLTKTPSEKLACIKDFIFGEDLLEMQNKIDGLIKKLKTKQNEADKRAIAAQSSISTIDRLLSQQTEEIEEIEYEFTLEEYQQQQNELKDKLKTLSDCDRKISNYNTQLSNLKRQMESIKAEYKKAESNVCPTCGQHLQDNTVINNIRQKANQIKQQAEEIKQSILNEQSFIVNLGSKLDLENDIEKINNIIIDLKHREKVKNNSFNRQKAEEEKAQQESALNMALSEKNYFTYELGQVNNLYKYFKTDFVQYVQKSFLNEIENYLNIYCHDVFDKDFKLVFSNNSLEILVDNMPLNFYSGGEQQRIGVLFLFAIKVALMSFTDKCTNLLILDEVLSGQDGEAFENCLELIDNLTTAEELTTILVSHRDVDYQLNKIIIERNERNTNLDIIEV